MMSDPRKPISPLPPRWKPSRNPAGIVVPGLDIEASITDQTEQIEQLITIKLQNVDENFSKIHNILANKILPSVKRYSIGTQPVREAAKFWTSFYEQAAQIRIPTYDDHSTVNEIPSDQEEETASDGEQDRTVNPHDSVDQQSMLEPSMTQTDASFTPSQAISSTPATNRNQQNNMDSFMTQGSDPSWANTMESPLFRLKSEIENFSSNDSSDFTPAHPSTSSSVLIPPTPDRTDVTILPSSTKSKGKGKAKEPDPLLRNVLRHNLYSNQSVDDFNSNTPTSPAKPKSKPKTPLVPKTYNPYLPPDSAPSQWSGIVDLNDPSAMTPQRYRHGKNPASHRKPKTPTADDSDDSFDELAGMSPPVMMSPARPPRSAVKLGALKLGQSPVKQAAARIKQDLVRDVHKNSAYKGRGYYGTLDNIDSSMSTVTTPPSLSKYHNAETSESIADSTLESMLRRVGLDAPSTAGLSSTPGLRLRPKSSGTGGGNLFNNPNPNNTNFNNRPFSNESEDDTLPPIQNPLFAPGYVDNYDDPDSDSDSDSLEMDEINSSVLPSAAFLMASQGRPGDEDDSFGSSNHSSDSLTDEDVGGLVPVHPFAGVVQDDGFDDDDSFDYDDGEVQEETVFGVPPAQRMQAQAARRAQGGLQILGGHLLDDTIGAQAVAGVGGVEESPTPAAWGTSAPLR